MTEDDQTLDQKITSRITFRVRELADKLTRRRQMMATAESCTGGWIAKCCTDINGSSGWFDRGFVTYSNQAKMDMINVSQQALDDYGAVSAQVAEQMASGACEAAGVAISVAVTGVAGPGGGSTEKPVGTVYFGWCVDGQVSVERCQFDGNRNAVRQQTVLHALEELLKKLAD